MSINKPQSKRFYDCHELSSWMKTHKNVDVESYLRDRFLRRPEMGNSALLTLYPNKDSLNEAEKALYEVFGREIHVKFWW